MKQKATETLLKLDQLLSQMEDEVYVKPIPSSGDATIGKHTRHILEFFQCLLEQCASGKVNYDNRKRNPMIETRIGVARELISDINNEIRKGPGSTTMLVLETDNPSAGNCMDTTFDRELWYNVEHAIHHMAIIKMVISYEHPHLKPDEDFGVAYSTVQHNKEVLNTN